MFTGSYFTAPYFPTRYFPKYGAAVTAWIQPTPDVSLLQYPLRRPQPLLQGWYADPTAATVLPAQLNFAPLQGTPDRPPPRRLPLRETAYFDPTAAWQYPAIVPAGIAASFFRPDRPLPPPVLHPSRMPFAFDPGVRVPDIDVAALRSWDQPLEQPRLVAARVPPAEMPGPVPLLEVVALSQAWDVAVQVPIRPRWRPILLAEARADLAPKDDLSYVSGWRQETVALPRVAPKALQAPNESRVDSPAVYDPQSLRVPLETCLDRPRTLPGPTRDVPSDATYGAGIAAATVATYAAFASPLPDVPRARPSPVREGYAVLTLDVSQAGSVPVPLFDLAILPVPRSVLARAALPATFEPPWYAAVVIIVAGPYWVPARAIWVSGAIAGEVGEE